MRIPGWLLLVSLLGGCGDAGPGSPDLAGLDRRAGDPDRGPLDRSRADALAGIEVSGTVTAYPAGKPLAGARVCRYEDGKKSEDCVSTNDIGIYRISVPAKVETGLFFESAGSERMFVPLLLDAPLANEIIMLWPDATAVTQYAKVGVTYPQSGKGSIEIDAAAGAVCRIEPKAGIGPVYANASRDLDPSLTAIQVGFAYVVDLAPGSYTVFCTAKSGSACDRQPGRGWPAASGGMRLAVLPGYVTGAEMACP